MTATATAPPLPLTRRSGLELAAAIRAGKTSSRTVVEEHIAVIERRNGELNAIVAERFDAARAEADAADARVAAAAEDEELPRFLGVPCTIKESFALQGMPNSAGMVARRELRAERTSTAAKRLIAAGAIPLGVTNTSELTLWIETTNRVYGRTRNPYDPRRTVGGSSGGEGASVGAGFAPIGLGTDFGGSIRLPAFFCGVFGHKPTGLIVPHTGHFPVPNAGGSRLLGIGPLARRAEDLWPFLSAIAGHDGEDQSVGELRLGDPAEVSLAGLPVALSDDASLWPASLELRNARVRAARALAERGAEVRRVSLRGARRTAELYLQAVREAGKLAEVFEEAGVPVPSVRHLIADGVRRRGDHTLPLTMTLLAERLSDLIPERYERKALAARDRLAREVEELIGDGVLLHPPFPRVAPRHGATVGRPWTLASTALFNLLGLPVTQVPLGLGERGLPLGVQVAGARDGDHVTIAVALELEQAFGGWVPPEDR
ncbi:MAG: amidase [Solirubrobacterales bacterium]